MEEILQELIRSTQEKGPSNKQFYSNLSITKPIHDHVEIHQRLEDAISYLKSRFKSTQGFQSKLYTSRNCAIESAQVDSIFKIPTCTGELLTSVLVLDLLFNHVENERFILPSFQEIICNFPHEILDQLHDFIVPSCGISTFNLFKQFHQAITPTPSPPPPNLPNNLLYREDFDSGNDSPTSFQTQEDSSDNVTSVVDNIPDDINTSMLALFVLLHQGILQAKPVESVLQWVISNVFNYEEGNVNQEVPQNSEILSEEEHKPLSITSFKFPMFIHGHQKSSACDDAVGVANLLNLLYHLDFSHELLLNEAEEFLVKTLNDTLTSLDVDVMCSGDITSTSSLNSLAAAETSQKVESVNSLGNTRNMISSHSDDDDDDEEKQCNGEANQHQPEFLLQHHSPDSLLYFLSRALAMTNNTNSSCRRPYIKLMKSLLLDLLDARLGTTMNICDLAMRILAGVYLGVVEVHNNAANFNSTINMPNEHHCSSPRSSSSSCSTAKSFRMNNLLQKEFELLVSLQNDLDGSWPADSIVQVGITGNQTNDFNNISGENVGVQNAFPEEGTMNCVEEIKDEVIAYLGGKELATVFAVKAISVFMSWKKGAFVSDSEDFWDTRKTENKIAFGNDAELHQLY